VSIVFIFHDSQRYIEFNKIGHQEKNSQSSKNPIPNHSGVKDFHRKYKILKFQFPVCIYWTLFTVGLDFATIF
jgi:hypothetical protein